MIIINEHNYIFHFLLRKVYKMGGISSNSNQKLENELGADFPQGENFVGFENVLITILNLV